MADEKTRNEVVVDARRESRQWRTNVRRLMRAFRARDDGPLPTLRNRLHELDAKCATVETKVAALERHRTRSWNRALGELQGRAARAARELAGGDPHAGPQRRPALTVARTTRKIHGLAAGSGRSREPTGTTKEKQPCSSARSTSTVSRSPDGCVRQTPTTSRSRR